MEVLPVEDGGMVLSDILGPQRQMAAAAVSGPNMTALRRAPSTSLNDFSPSQEALEPE